MPTWVFLRHGESQANAERWLSGAVDAPLTHRSGSSKPGREMSRKILRGLFLRLSRAHRTAQIVLQERSVPLTVSPLLQERSMGDWAYRSIDDVRSAGESHLLTAWKKAPPGGESNASLAGRSLSYLASVGDVVGPSLVVAQEGLFVLSWG